MLPLPRRLLSAAFRSARLPAAVFCLFASSVHADECIPDPREGIFCGGEEDPAGFLEYTIYGDGTATWNSEHLISGYSYYYTLTAGSSLRVTGAAADYFYQDIFVAGDGDFHLVGGYLRIPLFGALQGDIYVTNSHAAMPLYSYGANTSSASVVHLTDATLRLERSDFQSSVTLQNDVVLSGQAVLEVINPNVYAPGDITVTLDQTVSGDGTLIKAGPGLLRLSGDNTYGGGTHIASGDMEVFTDGNLGAANTSVTFHADTGMWLNDGFVSSARSTTLSGGLGHFGVRSGSAIWNGIISGDGGLVKSGPGTLTLTAANTHAGGNTVAGGSLVISSDANLGAADTALTLADGTTLRTTASFTSSARTLTLSGETATFELAASTRVHWTGATAGSGKLQITGAGDLILSGGIGHLGGADIAASSLEVSIAADLGETGSSTWAGAITGAGNFIKSGDGTLVLSGAASHTGATTVRGGTLRADAANVLSATSALFVVNGAVVDLAGHDQTVGDLDSYDDSTGQFDAGTVQLGGATLTSLNRVLNNWAGSLTGEGTLIKQGAATMNWSGENTFEGALQIDAGSIRTEADNTLSAQARVFVAADATLDLYDHAQTVAGLSGAGDVVLGSATLTLSTAGETTHDFTGTISGTGALVKTGAGTQILSGANTYDGGTTVNAGLLAVDADDRLGTGSLTLNGGGIRYGAAFDDLRAFTLGTNGATLDTGGFDVAYAHFVSGSGSFTKSGEGTLTLSGANTYAGGTTLSAGTLRADNANAFGTAGVRVDGGTLDLNGFAIANALDLRGGATTGLANYVGTQTVRSSQAYSGTVGGLLIVAQGGSVNTTGATFTGAATVQEGGFLSGTGTLASLVVSEGGTLAPGNSPGLLTVAGDLTLLGTTMMELGGLGRGVSYDAIDIGGAVTFGGTLQLTLLGDFQPVAESSFDLFDFGSATGEFSSVLLPTLAAGLEWDTTGLYSDGTLSITAAAIPEPASSAMLAAGAAFVLMLWIRRRSAGQRL